jgi:hypothetical protein
MSCGITQSPEWSDLVGALHPVGGHSGHKGFEI